MEAVDSFPSTFITIPWSDEKYNPYHYRAWEAAVQQASL